MLYCAIHSQILLYEANGDLLVVRTLLYEIDSATIILQYETGFATDTVWLELHDMARYMATSNF